MLKQYFFFSILFVLLNNISSWAQCGCTSSCITSIGSGNWDDCNRWIGVSCTGWSTATIMGNRRQEILSGSSILVPSSVSSFHGRSKGIYIHSGGILTVIGSIDGNSYFADNIVVCGTLNINGGNSDFSSATLTVYSGGLVNITAGVLKVDKIVVENGGTVIISGSGELSRDNSFSGLEIKAGGYFIINSSNAKLNYHGLSSTYQSTIDGTMDVGSSMTSFNSQNVKLGNTRVTNNTSTGRIRTQSAYLPYSDPVVPPSFSNNFFGSNSNYGGTVEYYGSSAIFLGSSSRGYYYDLEINNSAGVYLNNDTYTVGMIYLKNGNLQTNGKRLFVIGGIGYVGSNYIVGGVNSEIHFLGKLSNNTFQSSGLTTYLISSQGATVDIRNPQLRLSSSFGGSATLKILKLFREDVIDLRSQLTINNTLDLKVGKLLTDVSGPNFVIVSNTAANSVLHNTTGWAGLYGFVSGKLRRYVAGGIIYDFPVGYTGESVYTGANHRRITLDINSLSGLSYLDVWFNTPVADCNGQMTAVEMGTAYTGIHPEGYWTVIPNTGAYTADFDVELYTWGFNSPVLNDNQYAPVIRPVNGNCADWNIGGGIIPPQDSVGRVRLFDNTVDTSYALRRHLTSFSELAVGIVPFMPFIADAGNDTLLCYRSELPIGGNPSVIGGTPPYTYSWTPDSNMLLNTVANPMIRALVPITYTLTVTDAFGQIATDQIALTIDTSPDCTCDPPSGVNKTVTGNNLTISWNSDTNSLKTIVQFRVKPFQPGIVADQGITLVTGTTTTSFTLNPANCGKKYQARLRHVCLADNSLKSLWKQIPVIQRPACRLSENHDREISLYPNPVDNDASLLLKGFAGEKLHCTIFDVAGKLVLNHSYIAMSSVETYQWNDVGKLADGFYLLEVKSDSDLNVLPFVKR